MYLFTASQMRQADQNAIKAGIPSQLLMERAGQNVANYAQKHWSQAKQILIFCGKGNNGGDGYVAARYLVQAGFRLTVLELADCETNIRSEDARVARSALLSQLTPLKLNYQTVESYLNTADLIIDAVFGSGLSRALSADLAQLFDLINASNRAVLSIDVPSGVFSDMTSLPSHYLQASRTLQLAGPKIASAFYPARAAFGDWDVADIGLPSDLLEGLSDLVLLDDAYLQTQMPPRAKTTHKYSAGTVLVVGGTKAYLGAAELTARAALRGGAGLVTLLAEERLANSWPELIFKACHADSFLESVASISEKHAQVRVIGPGLLGEVQALVPKLIKQSPAVTVLDAGGLLASENWFEAVKQHGRCVLTPHAGEAAKLLECSVEQVNLDPLSSARALASKSNAVVVLKGASTVIAKATGRCFVSTRGHEGMATAGTGDVLAGLIASFVATTNDLQQQAALAVYIHGLAGESAAKQFGNGLIASDVIQEIARVLANLKLA